MGAYTACLDLALASGPALGLIASGAGLWRRAPAAGASGRVKITAKASQRARELGIDVTRVPPSDGQVGLKEVGEEVEYAKHTPVSEIGRMADLHAVPPRPPMTRVERLERWAEALDHEPDRVLTLIEGIEWQAEGERGDMHAESSALTIAFEDRVLRAEGLASDRLEDAVTFFRLTDHEAHFALCSCVYGRTRQAGVAAQRVRMIAQPSIRRRDGARQDLSMLWIAGTGLGGVIVASILLQLFY